MADWTGNAAKASEIREIKDIEARRQAILSWLKTTLDQHILMIPYLGERVQKAMWLDTLKMDGLLKPTDEQPEFKLHSSSSRTRELVAAKKEDGDKWSVTEGGPKFNALIKTYIDKDAGNGGGQKKKTRMSSKDIELRREIARSSLAKSVFSMTEGEPQENFQVLDETAALWEQKTEAALAALDSLKPEIQAVVKKIFETSTMMDFNAYLKESKS